MPSKKKVWLVTIRIESDAWDYKQGDQIIIPVYSISGYHADQIVKNYVGSEYPSYSIISIAPCDNFLFKPILRDYKTKSYKDFVIDARGKRTGLDIVKSNRDKEIERRCNAIIEFLKNS